jgi:hypothetical protein
LFPFFMLKKGILGYDFIELNYFRNQKIDLILCNLKSILTNFIKKYQ